MTDRFARTDGSVDAPCDPTEGPYCGGSWRGIIDQLDYIQGMGFDAVYISPVIENLEGNTAYGEAYHGYWPQNLYAVNEHFGTEDDLLALSEELHKRDMYFMVDVVINDMGFATKEQILPPRLITPTSFLSMIRDFTIRGVISPTLTTIPRHSTAG